MVYVQNADGKPLMPTSRHGKVKHLLRNGQAIVVTRCPFTIRLTNQTTEYTQPITLGVDAGSKVIGLSATTEAQELYAAEVELRTDIVDLLATRRTLRRSRRNRKTRYRQPRFDNRRKTKKPGWLAPSIQHKIETHLRVIEKVHKILPITDIVVEVASFDIQRIKNDLIEGVEYQEGEQLGFWNVREYVLFRDSHICQHCKGKSKDKILNVHHLESRKTGGDAPNNLITLCDTCHDAYHQGKVDLKVKRGPAFRDAAFMGIMRWTFYEQLKAGYPNVHLTYGYLTKNTRIRHSLPKGHRTDALCIAGIPEAKRVEEFFCQRKVRRHNRQIHKANPQKGSLRKRNQASYEVHGYRLFDKVSYQGQECFIFGRRSSGYFDLRKLDGTIVHRSASYKKLMLLERQKAYLIERRMCIPPSA